MSIIHPETNNTSPITLQVFGDSHSKYFGVTPKVRLGAKWLSKFQLESHPVPASTIVGLGKKRSKLNVRDYITEKSHKNSMPVLGFGQVDLELGYYYRRVIKQEDITLNNFVDDLHNTYRTILDDLPQMPEGWGVLKGLNLSVLKHEGFAVRYISRIINENITGDDERQEHKEMLGNVIDSYEARNQATIRFNHLLQKTCIKNGWGYFDINDQLCNFRPEDGVADEYIPAGVDHHIVDTLSVRKMFISELYKQAEEVVLRNAGALRQ